MLSKFRCPELSKGALGATAATPLWPQGDFGSCSPAQSSFENKPGAVGQTPCAVLMGSADRSIHGRSGSSGGIEVHESCGYTVREDVCRDYPSSKRASWAQHHLNAPQGTHTMPMPGGVEAEMNRGCSLPDYLYRGPPCNLEASRSHCQAKAPLGHVVMPMPCDMWDKGNGRLSVPEHAHLGPTRSVAASRSHGQVKAPPGLDVMPMACVIGDHGKGGWFGREDAYRGRPRSVGASRSHCQVKAPPGLDVMPMACDIGDQGNGEMFVRADEHRGPQSSMGVQQAHCQAKASSGLDNTPRKDAEDDLGRPRAPVNAAVENLKVALEGGEVYASRRLRSSPSIDGSALACTGSSSSTTWDDALFVPIQQPFTSRVDGVSFASTRMFCLTNDEVSLDTSTQKRFPTHVDASAFASNSGAVHHGAKFKPVPPETPPLPSFVGYALGKHSNNADSQSGPTPTTPRHVYDVPNGQRFAFHMGSKDHAAGTCRPCAYAWRATGCAKGDSCERCHLCDESAFKNYRSECRRGKRGRT